MLNHRDSDDSFHPPHTKISSKRSYCSIFLASSVQNILYNYVHIVDCISELRHSHLERVNVFSKVSEMNTRCAFCKSKFDMEYGNTFIVVNDTTNSAFNFPQNFRLDILSVRAIKWESLRRSTR